MKRRPIWPSAGLLYLLFVNANVGLWATIAPRSFYDDFPGGGRSWLTLDGPFNEHLIRDVGASSLGMAVVVAAALWTLSRPIVVTAGVATAVFALPHAIYHSRHSEVIGSTFDQVASIGGLYLAAVIGVAVALDGLLRDRAPTEHR